MICYLSREESPEGPIIHLLAAVTMAGDPEGIGDFHIRIPPGSPPIFGRSYSEWTAARVGPVEVEIGETPEAEPLPERPPPPVEPGTRPEDRFMWQAGDFRVTQPQGDKFSQPPEAVHVVKPK